ncbi:thioesterase family protein [Phycicoccus sp. Soil802]|uniref:thioesterase family protein n=1 Tax=Phycicoccus sp. Soil802 TaxID=1736414 RepID=UPI0009E95D6E|nr:thioesterase family protein [Phycicoccus sp. Soil802]
MSPAPEAFYVLDDTEAGASTVTSTSHTAGPWSPHAQHGGPPMALMAREAQRLGDGSRVVARLTCDLLGPVPVGRLRVEAVVARPGRSVELVECELADADSGRVAARAAAWLVPRVDSGPVAGLPTPPSGPATGGEGAVPPGWHPGYLDAIEWSWVEGSLEQVGPATVWMRPRVPLVTGEPMAPLERLMVCVDSASGASAALEITQWQFMNTELTAHLVREPAGEWIGLRARTTLGGGAAGLAQAEVFDEEGFVGRTAQALLVRPTPGA